MSNSELLGLLNPTIAVLFAATFFVFWNRQRDKTYIAIFGFSYLALALGFVVSHMFLTTLSMANILVAGPIYAAASIGIVSALYLRVGKPLELRLPVALSVIIVGVIGFFLTSTEELNARIIGMNSLVGVLFAIGAFRLSDGFKLGEFDRVISIMLVLIAAQSTILPAVSLYLSGPLTIETYRSSMHWVVLNFATALLSVSFALCLISMCANDLLKQITALANIDALSGLSTRRAFDEEATSMIARAERANIPLSMLILDLDHFKKLNDEFGHPGGDAVIAGLGKIFNNRLRSTDSAGRIGGEEFCILLWDTDIHGARMLAEDLRLACRGAVFAGPAAGATCTISVGVAQRMKGEEQISIYRRADKALYVAKRQGRDLVSLAEIDAEPASVSPSIENLLDDVCANNSEGLRDVLKVSDERMEKIA